MMAASTKLSALFAAKHDGQPSATHPYDVTLILIALALMSIGVVIVTSASMPVPIGCTTIRSILLFATVFILLGRSSPLWWY